MKTEKPSFHGYLLRQPKPNSQQSRKNVISIEQFLENGYDRLSMGITSNDTLWNEEISQPEEPKPNPFSDPNSGILWISPEA